MDTSGSRIVIGVEAVTMKSLLGRKRKSASDMKKRDDEKKLKPENSSSKEEKSDHKKDKLESDEGGDDEDDSNKGKRDPNWLHLQLLRVIGIVVLVMVGFGIIFLIYCIQGRIDFNCDGVTDSACCCF